MADNIFNNNINQSCEKDIRCETHIFTENGKQIIQDSANSQECTELKKYMQNLVFNGTTQCQFYNDTDSGILSCINKCMYIIVKNNKDNASLTMIKRNNTIYNCNTEWPIKTITDDNVTAIKTKFI